MNYGTCKEFAQVEAMVQSVQLALRYILLVSVVFTLVD